MKGWQELKGMIPSAMVLELAGLSEAPGQSCLCVDSGWNRRGEGERGGGLYPSHHVPAPWLKQTQTWGRACQCEREGEFQRRTVFFSCLAFWCV